MAEIGFVFEIEGERLMDRRLSRFGENITDLRPFWTVLIADLRKIEKEQFSSEGSRSRAWLPLSYKYFKWKMRKFPGTKTLERTGRLRDSLIGKTADSIVEVAKLEMRFGTSVPYAGRHQTGSIASASRGRLPRRRPIDINEGDRRRWMKLLQRFAVAQAQAAGRLR